MIPKIIHYCWFGNNPKPDSVKKYIDQWKEKLPDYKFMEWNESNFDIEKSIPYVKQAYTAKKYAFVSDYARIDALCNYGGVYFDTDIEVIKDFSKLLEDASAVFGYERPTTLTTAFLAAEKECPLFLEFRDTYKDKEFINPDLSDNWLSINRNLREFLKEKGYNLSEKNHTEAGNIKFYKSEYFSGFDIEHWHENITENSYTVHHFDSSWQAKHKGFKKIKVFIKHKLIRPALYLIFGQSKADKIEDKMKNKQ